MFEDFAGIGRSADAGKTHFQYLYKATTPAAGTAGFFVDLSQSGGIPKYNPLAGSELTATQLEGAGNFGVYPGTFGTGSKHLLRWQMLSTGTPPDFLMLCDYLLFYPLIDGDAGDQQVMTNTATLPRYTTGEGVRIVLVVTAPMALTAPITVVYTNQAGVTGRSVTVNIIPGTSIGVCATGTGGAGIQSPTPFIPLASGDSGVRAIESVTMGSAAGGFLCAILVRPIASMQLYEVSVPVEKQYPIEGQVTPEVMPGACLNLLIQRGGTASSPYFGEFVFVNS